MWSNACPRSGTCTSTSRAWTRSNGPGGGSSRPTSCTRTSKGRAGPDPIHETSMSVAITEPVGPTCSARKAGTFGPPAPTSQHRQPGLIPRRRR